MCHLNCSSNPYLSNENNFKILTQNIEQSMKEMNEKLENEMQALKNSIVRLNLTVIQVSGIHIFNPSLTHFNRFDFSSNRLRFR